MNVVTVSQHYFRPTRTLSSQRLHGAALFAAFSLAAALPALAQYPGQVRGKSKDNAQLRAIAVLEWIGEAGKPKACRIVPVTVYDGQQLQDAGVYLARPQPLALAGEVEYQLKDNGRTIGLFDVKNSGQIEGAWVGFGEWKDLPKPKTEAGPPPKVDAEDDSDDKPVLHRKKHADDSAKSGDSGDSKAPAQDKSGDKTSNTASSSPAPDPGHPTLHKKTDDSSNSSADSSADSAPVDPDRPVMKKPKPKPVEVAADDAGNVSSLPGATDPDRPHLKRGLSNADSLKVVPTLMGLPPDMEQAIAVSDGQNHPDHPWAFSWANPGDEDKMKTQMEDLARQALGIAQPTPAPAPAKAAPRTAAARRKAAQAVPPPAPATLEEERFRVFELAYGSGATMVLTADTGGAMAQEKFVTLIAQPDLYGNVLVVMKSVTDGSHLDETPRMRLVDAVDALADNRGELLFELRGETSRQFALYRVLRGRADKLFTAFAGNFSLEDASNN
jgi:hypothetical protein